jgi:hypothetical protein
MTGVGVWTGVGSGVGTGFGFGVVPGVSVGAPVGVDEVPGDGDPLPLTPRPVDVLGPALASTGDVGLSLPPPAT